MSQEDKDKVSKCKNVTQGLRTGSENLLETAIRSGGVA